MGEVLFFWRGAGGADAGAAADTDVVASASSTAATAAFVAAAADAARGAIADDIIGGASSPPSDSGGEKRESGFASEPGGNSPSDTAVATVGGRDIALADGDILVIPAGEVHSVAAASASELWLVWVLGERDFAFQSSYDLTHAGGLG